MHEYKILIIQSMFFDVIEDIKWDSYLIRDTAAPKNQIKSI